MVLALFYVAFENLRTDVSLKYAEKHSAILCNAVNICPEIDIKARSFVIDENGYVLIDSMTFERCRFLRPDDTDRIHIKEKIEAPKFVAAIEEYLQNVEYFFQNGKVKVISIHGEGCNHTSSLSVRIAPINDELLSVVTLFCKTSMLVMGDFAPLFILLIVALIVFIIIINIASNKLIFAPLWRLVRNLNEVKDEKESDIYGIDRQDELGELSKAIKKLFHEAHVDTLTGTYNRRHMEKTLPDLMNLLSRSGDLLSVLMVDIDNFKNYNDTYGHDAGDACLKAIATVLNESVNRKGDLVIRYGGEEFLIVLPNTDENGARVISEKLLAGVINLKIQHTNNDVSNYVTISIGAVTGKVSQNEGWQSYIKRADEALYMSKNNNKNSYTFLNMEEN